MRMYMYADRGAQGEQSATVTIKGSPTGGPRRPRPRHQQHFNVLRSFVVV